MTRATSDAAPAIDDRVRGEEQSTSAELHAPARRMLVEYEARAAGRQGVGPISDHCTLKIGYGARDDVPLSCERLQTLGSRRSTAPSAERRFDLLRRGSRRRKVECSHKGVGVAISVRDGHEEEALYRAADHRFFEGSGKRGASERPVSQPRFQRLASLSAPRGQRADAVQGDGP